MRIFINWPSIWVYLNLCVCVCLCETLHSIDPDFFLTFWSNFGLLIIDCVHTNTDNNNKKSYRPMHSARIFHHSGRIRTKGQHWNRWNENTAKESKKCLFLSVGRMTVLPNELFVFFKQRTNDSHIFLCVYIYLLFCI